MTGQVTFDSHVLHLVSVAARLVNHLTPGHDGGRIVGTPGAAQRRAAAAGALGGEGRPVPAVSAAEADALTSAAADMRRVFESSAAGDLAAAALVVNELMARTGARPQLDPLPGGSTPTHMLLASIATEAGSMRVIPTGKQSTGSREELGGWHVHFHGTDDTLATGWTAGCATALALAIGSDLAGRLGICEAQRCDRVYVDTSRNSSKRFCSLACQNRTKAAAHRARR